MRAPGGTRTRNLPHRKRELYPLSYGSKTCDMQLYRAPGRNRTRACHRTSTGRSYRTELQGRGTCAPTRIRAGGRRARSSGGGNRTRDYWLMKPALYHLSYTRIHAANSALALHGAASIHFCPGGRTRTYNIHCIRVALSPVELRRKTRKQGGKRAPTPHEYHASIRSREQTNVTNDSKEETKPALVHCSLTCFR